MNKKWIIVFVLIVFVVILVIYYIKATEKENHVPDVNYAIGLSDELPALCQGIFNSRECAAKVEAYQLKKGIEGVARNEKELIIYLLSGEKVTFTDSKDDDPNGKWYHYQDYFPTIQYHLIHVQYYEGRGYIFLNATSGKYKEIQEIPLISPDGKRGAIISICEAYCDTGIVIIRMTDKDIFEEFSLTPKEDNWVDGNLQWIDSDNLKCTIKGFYYNEEKKYIEVEKNFFLRYGDNDWKVEGY